METFDSAIKNGVIKDLSSDQFPTELVYFSGEPITYSRLSGTYIGYVIEGTVTIFYYGNTYTLVEGMYFSVPKYLNISGEGEAIIMTRIDYDGFFLIGGPVEHEGRLTYIDGCTDSLLISPVMMGDPCLNLLHIPHYTKQSQHTHPSLRLGVIISGEGICKTPEGDFPLEEGTVFYIPQDEKHSFHTTDHNLRVIAYHPDSDFGPTHNNHPMVNKTVL